jgi:hypothetical protein
LRRNAASGSEAVHLHWHLLVNDLALGRWRRAYRRFILHILPEVGDGAARTDGPSALWYLALSAPSPLNLPWQPLASEAKLRLDESDSFLALHDALALAGARDFVALDAWLALRDKRGETTLVLIGLGLHEHIAGDRDKAASLLRAASADVAKLGGSRAQQRLLERFATGDTFSDPFGRPQDFVSGSKTDQILT